MAAIPEKIRLGIVGLGAAGRAFIAPIRASNDFEFIAFAEQDDEVRQKVCEETGVRGYRDLPAMLEMAGLDAVYVATPTELHSEHVRRICSARKHVLAEKPMAASLDEAKDMIDDAERAGVVLMVGHSHSYDMPIREMRKIIAAGSLGRPRMIQTWSFSDWIYRPRRPEELEVAKGGGVTYRQGSHQFDIIRYLGGGMLRSVRAATFDWDPARPSIGAHVVFLQFTDGAAATAVYNGYGQFSSVELCANISEWGHIETAESRRPVSRNASGAAPADEISAKRRRATDAIPFAAPYQPFFGLTIVSCERGDLRQSPTGIYVYSGTGREEIALPADRSPRTLVLNEFSDAIRGITPATHDGRWGLATLEVCTAAILSSQCGKEIELAYQVPVKC